MGFVAVVWGGGLHTACIEHEQEQTAEPRGWGFGVGSGGGGGGGAVVTVRLTPVQYIHGR